MTVFSFVRPGTVGGIGVGGAGGEEGELEADGREADGAERGG